MIGILFELAGIPFGLAGIPFELAGVPFGLNGTPFELKGLLFTRFLLLNVDFSSKNRDLEITLRGGKINLVERMGKLYFVLITCAREKRTNSSRRRGKRGGVTARGRATAKRNHREVEKVKERKKGKRKKIFPFLYASSTLRLKFLLNLIVCRNLKVKLGSHP
ncbi:MAG: hypothetical protein LBK63_14330 [Treponema sp.]|nr:hypothetical protein [Treponema sp.]